MDRGAWRATVHGVTKSRTGLSSPTGSRAFGALFSPLFPSYHPGLHLQSTGLWLRGGESGLSGASALATASSANFRGLLCLNKSLSSPP